MKNQIEKVAKAHGVSPDKVVIGKTLEDRHNVEGKSLQSGYPVSVAFHGDDLQETGWIVNGKYVRI